MGFHKIFNHSSSLVAVSHKKMCWLSLCPRGCRYEVQEEDGERMNLPVYFRERHNKHVGSSTSTVLFGQPLLITVPKHNLIADVLYDKILERIG